MSENAALFRNGRDARFQRLWNDCRFQELHHRQQRLRKRRLARTAAGEGRSLGTARGTLAQEAACGNQYRPYFEAGAGEVVLGAGAEVLGAGADVAGAGAGFVAAWEGAVVVGAGAIELCTAAG